jgi:arsenate reductase (thioredoxin)
MRYPIRVLFLCTGNSARSQMAEGLLRAIGGGDFEINSAGTDPKGLNPLTIEAMRESGIDISGHQSKSLERFLGHHFDYIITVCDRARDSCPTFPGDNQRIHWGFEDPAAVTGTRAEQLAVFRRVRNEISERLRVWVTVQRKRLKDIDHPA